jgi:MFS family permease
MLSAAYFVSMLDRYLMSIAIVPVKAQMALSDVQLALVHTTGFIVLYTIVSVGAGRLADRTNRRNLIAIGVAVWSLATAACAFAETFWPLFIARLGVGIGEAVLIPAGASMIAAMFDHTRMGKAMAIFTSGASLGGAAALLAGGYLYGIFEAAGGAQIMFLGHFRPWQVLFLVGALPGVVIAFAMLTVREPAREDCDPLVARPSMRDVLTYLATNAKAYLSLLIPIIGTYMMSSSVAVWGVALLARGRSIELADAAIIAGLISIVAGPLGMLLGGAALDRLSRIDRATAAPRVLVASLLLCVIPAIALALSSNVAVILVGFGSFVAVASIAGPATYGGLQLITPERFRGSVTAIVIGVGIICALGLGPLVMGALSDQLFSGPSNLRYAYLLFVVFLAVVGAIVTLMLGALKATNAERARG